MSFTPVNNNLFSPVESNNNTNEKDAKLKHLRKVCADFESIFLQKMLSSMRETIDESSLMGDGLGADMYQNLFDTEMSKEMASAGGMGIGEILYRELAQRDLGQNENSKELTLKQPVSLKNIINSEYKKLSNLPMFEKIGKFKSTIEKASQKYDVPENLIYGVIAQESAGDPNAESHVGAKGLMQLMDGTANEMGVKNSFDPHQNIEGGVKYLKEQLDRFDGDVDLALAAYNAGPGNVKRYGGVPPFKETQNYIKKVQNYADTFNKRLGDV